MLDGQDGLVAGVAAIAALALALVLDRTDAGRAVDLALALAGALVGFLVWNRPPAAIFLGNGGAYAVGLVLSLLAATAGARDGMRGALAAGLCLAVPAFEVVLTVIRRLGSESGVIQGDRLHSYDLLTARVGRWRSTLAFWGLGAVSGGLGVLAAASSLVVAAVLGALVALAGIALALVMRARAARVRQSR
jgi:UDP-GlcNAc:undecaprenyl-phosphate GlcNAc-1-phosphate transferase